MARAGREVPAGVIQHLMWHGIREAGLFVDEEDFGYFLKQMVVLAAHLNVTLYAYCLLSTHVHMLAKPNEDNLPSFMQRLGHRYAMRFNWKYSTYGHVFSDRYLPIAVTNDSYLLTLSRYIHLNPREARIVARPEDYPWSSCQEYLGLRNNSFIDSDLVLDQFRSDCQGREIAIAAYLEYLDEFLEGDGLPPIRRTGGVLVYDNDAVNPVSQPQLREPLPERSIPIDLVMEIVNKNWIEPAPPLQSRRRDFEKRNATLWLAHRLTGETWLAISERFNICEATARLACRRLERTLEVNTCLPGILAALEKAIIEAAEAA